MPVFHPLSLAHNYELCGVQDEDDDDAGALAAVGCLRAISTIMESVSTLPHMYPQIEVMCMPIMVKMLSADDQDVYEEVLEMVRPQLKDFSLTTYQ